MFSIIYGAELNNSVEAQLEAIFSTGSTDPGTVWIIIGAVLAFGGVALVMVGVLRTLHTTPAKPQYAYKRKQICTRCNAPVDEGVSFCMFCGNKMAATQPVAVNPILPQANPIPPRANPIPPQATPIKPVSPKPEPAPMPKHIHHPPADKSMPGLTKPDDSDLD